MEFDAMNMSIEFIIEKFPFNAGKTSTGMFSNSIEWIEIEFVETEERESEFAWNIFMFE